MGFVASKKVGNAVKRNRAKRLMREVVRISQPCIPKNIHLILIARRSILSAKFCEIIKSFNVFINKFIVDNCENKGC